MQKRASESMEDPKKKMCDWRHKRRDCWEEFKFHYPKTACSLQYGVLALVVLGCHVLSRILSDMANVDYFRYPLSETFRHPFNLTANLTINRTPIMQGTEIYASEMYADNARSILCTLVGSEAAIVAIVVSLTLIAIELTASAYSPRVIKISLKNPDMWFLLLIYGVAIFSSIIILKQLPYESRFPTEDVSFAFWLGVLSYAALVPYLWNIPQLLDPTNIVKRVSADIEKDTLLKYINKDLKKTSKKDETDGAKETSMTNGDTEGHEENPIQPILDIVYRSINNYDLETVRNGLEQIVKLAEKVIVAYSQDNALGKDNDKLLKKQIRFSKHFCNPLRRISRLAASKDDEESTREVIKTLQTLGEKTADKQLNVATEQVAVTLGAVGKFSAGKGKAFEDAVSEVAMSLEEVGKAAAEKKLNAVKLVALTLGDVGAFYAEKGKELEDAVKQIAKSLEEVGVTAATEVLEAATTEVAIALKAVGLAAAKKKLEDATGAAVTSLREVETEAVNRELKDATLDIVISLEAVGKVSAENKLKDVTSDAIFGLADVEEAAVVPDLESTVTRAADALEVVGNAAIKSKLEAATKDAVEALIALGKTAAEKSLENVIMKVNKSLAELKSNSNIVEPTISECELSGQNDQNIQKFIRQFKDYLEKMKPNASE